MFIWLLKKHLLTLSVVIFQTLGAALHLCIFFCLAFASPSWASHYKIRQCVLLHMCQWWGTNGPLAAPLFTVLISSLVFFFPSKLGTSCRGKHRLITSPPTYPHSQLISPFMDPKLFFFFLKHSLSDLPPHSARLPVSSEPNTLDPWNWCATPSSTNWGSSYAVH